MASIRKRGKGYQITVSNGRKSDGTQIVETATFIPDPSKTERQNRKALEKFVVEFEDKVLSGQYLNGGKMLYKDYVELWLKDYAQKQMEQTSIERCENSLNNLIVPEIGHLKLSQIRPLHIQDFYNKLLKDGYTVQGKKKSYKANTIKRIHQIISSSLNTAVQWQLIESNPCKRVKPPKPDRSVADIKYFTLEQAKTFLDYLDEEYTTSSGGRIRKDGSPSARHFETHTVPLQQKIFFFLALFGGFRLGESIALTWNDVDFKNNTISITKSAARTKQGQITKAPKNYSSVRTVSMPLDVMKMLKQYKSAQNVERLSLGSYWQGEGHIFTKDNGAQMDISTPNHAFKKIIKRYNEDPDHKEKLPEITLHGLRHTSATLLIADRVDLKTVSSRLGHSEISTTMDIYAHALRKKDEAAADALGGMFKSAK